MARIADDELCPCHSGFSFGECHRKKIESRRPKVTRHIVLVVIAEPDPNSRAVFDRRGEGTLIFEGRMTEISYDCGNCSAPLVAGLSARQFRGMVLRCNGCGRYNETIGCDILPLDVSNASDIPDEVGR